MSVFKVRSSPFYQFDFQIQGLRFSGSTKFRNERDAKDFEKARRAEAERLIAEEAATGRKGMTLRDATERWWQEVGARGNDPDIRRALDWLVGQIGPKTMLADINDDLVTRAVEARRAHVMRAGRDDKGKQLYRPIGNRTVNKTVSSLLSRVMNRAKKKWSVLIPNMPEWTEHKLPERKRPVREITADEDAKLDVVESIDYAQFREFAEIMGLRRKELLLTWPQVDFNKSTVSLIGKGGKPATLPLPRRAYEILWGLKGNHDWWVFTFVAERTRKCPKTGRQFVKGKRYPMTYYGVGSNKRSKWRKAGVQARLHDTRHTTGMRTLRATGNLKLVQTLLRHTDIGTTSRFYTDSTMDDVRAGLEATIRNNESRKNPQTFGEESKKSLRQRDK
jgi:integrase